MCRLFAMSGGREPVRATFWLLEAPDSLAAQSHRNPEQRGRVFAHNGALEELPALEARLDPATRALIDGDTDSERLFALITQEVEAAGGDVGAGITAAVRWGAANLRVFAINLILATPGELWALRYPDAHELYVLEREPRPEPLHHRSDAGRIAVRSEHRGATAVVASEPMDDHPGWRLLDSGELVHVDAGLRVHSQRVIDHPPAHPLTLADLGEQARSSQQAA
ncbi:MAG: class II glutamine amidotransferase [Solirubrobacteraceae bacterium]